MPAALSQPTFATLVESDVEIPLRDGARLRCNVYRPATPDRVPAILCLGAYQKDKVWSPPPDLGEDANPHFHWETPNPLFWVPRGYALVRIDTRGSGHSPGRTDPWSPAEAQDYYDAIEWSARTPWSTGKTGLLGLSYHAITQWLVANLQPPSLTAMIPWEGAADMYRDFAFTAACSAGASRSIGITRRWRIICSAGRKPRRPMRSSIRGCGTTCATASTARGTTAVARSGATSRFRFFRPEIGAEWACICAAMSRASRKPPQRTSGCVSIRALTMVRSTARRGATISCASSIIFSRTSIPGCSTNRVSSCVFATAVAAITSGARKANGRSRARAGRSTFCTPAARSRPQPRPAQARSATGRTA